MTASWIAIVIALWVVVLVLAALVLGLSRRLRELSEGVAARPAAQDRGVTGPAVGSSIDLASSESVAATQAHEIGPRDRVVLFMSASCGPCHALTEQLMAARQDGFALNGSDLVLVTDEDGVDFYSGLEPDQFLVQTGNDISRRLGVNATPYGVAVDAMGVVRWSGLTTRVDDVQSMVAAFAVKAH